MQPENLNDLARKHRGELAERQAQAEGPPPTLESDIPEMESLWRRKETGRVYHIQYADETGVFAKGIMEMWRGPLEAFLNKFEPVEGNEQ